MTKLEAWGVIFLAVILATLAITITELALRFQPIVPAIGGLYA